MWLPGLIEQPGASSILEKLAAAIAPGLPIERGNGAAVIDEDFHRLDRLLLQAEERQAARLWTNRRCLVTTRRFAAMPGFDAAAAASAARGWPVFVRASGGTTVVHRPGMLNVSRFEIWRRDEIDTVVRFRHFCDRLARALRSLGLAAGTGPIVRSYCDGRFNIVVDGRKIAGTASLFRQRQGWAGLLSHATIWIDGDLSADVGAIVDFERELGLAADYAHDAHASVTEQLAVHTRGSA
jgi:lipoate-protein ligase A